MTGYVHTFYGFIYASLFIIVFVTATNSLKPFKPHKTRKVSTMALKLSYLAYLSFYLLFIYILLFQTESKLQEDAISDKWIKFYLALFLVITIIPNIGIVLRRKIKKARVSYNIAFSIINSLMIVLILFLITNKTWGILS